MGSFIFHNINKIHAHGQRRGTQGIARTEPSMRVLTPERQIFCTAPFDAYSASIL